MTAAVHLRRLFFALWPDEKTRDALRRVTRSVVRHCGGRPVPPASYHVTLAFLGNVPDEQFESVHAAARRLRPEPLTLVIDRLGHFAAPQVLWAGPTVVPEPLAQFAADLGRALAAAGLRLDPRPFHPHVTIARKVLAPPEREALRAVEWPVAGFALLESQTDPAGARYRVIAGFPEGM